MHTDRTTRAGFWPALSLRIATWTAFAFACCCFLGCQSETPRATVTPERSDSHPTHGTNEMEHVARQDHPPFGKYDTAVIKTVENRWDDLLDEIKFGRERTGFVTIRFQLHADGNVSDLVIVKATVDTDLGKLALSAIRDVAPFSPWPDEMRKAVKSDVRDVTFTFNY
jgi:TonB family protein